MAINRNLVRDYARINKENTKLKKEIEEKNNKIEELKKENRKLKKEKNYFQKDSDHKAGQIKSLKDRHQQDLAKIRNLEKETADLKESLAKLISSLNRNSDNSSESTGTDPNTPRSEKKPKAANEYNGRRKSNRKRGAQPGHKGKSLGKKDLERLLKQANVFFETTDIGDPDLPYNSEYELDFNLIVKITERRIHQDSDVPLRAHRGSILYGKSFKALCVLLNTEFNISYHKIGKFIASLTHGVIHPATGTIFNCCRDFAKKADGKVREMALKLLNEPILGTDATVMITGGKRRYIRIYTTPDKALYQALATKTYAELKKETFLPEFKGTLVHDHESVRFHFGTDNAKCLIHELRYLRRCQDETGNAWSYKMEEFLQQLLIDRDRAIKEDRICFSEQEIENYTRSYQKILKEGFKENKKTRYNFARQNERSLLGRLQKYEHNVLLFLTDFNIPPDNNLCEARLRGCKTKQKVTGGFKTLTGLANYCNSLTVLRNLKINNEDILASLENYF